MNQSRAMQIITDADRAGTAIQIDQIAWMFSNFPVDHAVRMLLSEAPRIWDLVTEMDAETGAVPFESSTENRSAAHRALLHAVSWRERPDCVGQAADAIAGFVSDNPVDCSWRTSMPPRPAHRA